MSIGISVVLVLVRRVAPAEAVGIGRAERGEQRDAGLDRPERRAIEHVDLAAAAAGLRVLVERRLEDAGRKRTPGSPSAFIASAKRSASTHGAPSSSNGLVVPRPSETLVPSNSTVPG